MRLGTKAGEVQPMFVSVDPGRDTPAVIGQSAASFPPVIGLTGTPDQVGQVARAYRVYCARHKTGAGLVAPIPADADASKIAADVEAHLS